MTDTGLKIALQRSMSAGQLSDELNEVIDQEMYRLAHKALGRKKKLVIYDDETSEGTQVWYCPNANDDDDSYLGTLTKDKDGILSVDFLNSQIEGQEQLTELPLECKILLIEFLHGPADVQPTPLTRK